MRKIEIKSQNDEEIIRLYATKGRKHFVAVLEDADENYRTVERNGVCVLQRGLSRIDAIMHAESIVAMLKRYDGINLVPIEASAGILHE